jgi:tetrahydromethanopterin S-methyltransferase subunit H
MPYYITFSPHGCSCVHNAISVDAAVTSLSAIAQGAIEQAILRGFNTSQNSYTDLLVLYSITSGRMTTFTGILKIRNPTIFTANVPFIVNQLKL